MGSPGPGPSPARAAYGQRLAHFLNFRCFSTFGPAQATRGLWAAPAQARAQARAAYGQGLAMFFYFPCF